jgi:hypothetical protein
VRWFLTSVTPRVPPAIAQSQPTTPLRTQPLAAIPTRPANVTQPIDSAGLVARSAGLADGSSGSSVAASAAPNQRNSGGGAERGSPPFSATVSTGGSPLPGSPAIAEQPPTSAEASLVASTRAAQDPQAIQIGWHDIAGETIADQAKTVLAAIGILAMILQALRWLSREEAAA